MITDSILGVLSGLIGSVVTTISNNRAQKQKNEHEFGMRRLDIEAMQAEAELNIRITETQVQGEVERIEAQAYAQNLQQANVRELSNDTVARLFDNKWTAWLGAVIVFLLGFVDFLKGFMRPALTMYLTLLTSWLTFKAYGVLMLKEEFISGEMASTIFQSNMETVTYLTVSVITWWFADRRVAKFAYRLNDGNLREK